MLSALLRPLQLGLLVASLSITAVVATASPRSSSSAAHRTNEGAEIRRFFHDVLAATAAPEAGQAHALQEAIARHPRVFTWLAEGRDVRSLLAQADLLGPPQVGQKNMSTLLAEFMETRGRAILESQGVTERLGSEVTTQARGAIEALGSTRARTAAQKTARMGTQKFMDLPFDERMEILELADPKIYSDTVARLNQKMAEAKVSELDAFRAVLENSAQFDGMRGIDPDTIAEFIGYYFDELPLEDRRKIMLAFLSLPPRSPVEKQISAVIQNSGPTLQKFFQLIGRDAKSPQVKAALEDLLDNVQPFSGDEAVLAIEEAYGRKIDEIFKTFDRKPIKAGTIGQVHFGVLKDGTPVAIKIRRPGIKAKVEREIGALERILKTNLSRLENSRRVGKVARTGILNKLLEKLKESTLEELDFEREARLLDRAQSYVDGDLGISVVRRIDSLPVRDDVLVMTRAAGVPLTDLSVEELKLQQKAIYNVIQKWTDLALFEGFFHADLHGGNAFVMKGPEGSKLDYGLFEKYILKKRPEFLVTLIDFGNSGEMSLELRRAFVKMAFAAIGGDAEDMVNALGTIGNLKSEARQDIIKSLKEKKFSQLSIQERLDSALTSAIENGFEVPVELTKLVRGQFFLERELSRINDEIMFRAIREKLGLSDADEPLSEAILGAIKNSPSQMVDGLEDISGLAKIDKARDLVMAKLDQDELKPLTIVERLKRAIEAVDSGGGRVPAEIPKLIESRPGLGLELKSLEKLLGRNKFTSNRAYATVVSKRLARNLPAQLVSKRARESAVLELSELSTFLKENAGKLLGFTRKRCLAGKLEERVNGSP